MKVKRICEICGKEFEVKLSKIKCGLGNYCSHSCAAKSRIREKNHNWKGGKVKRICKQCGKEFEVKFHVIKDNEGVFCSRYCQGKWKSENIRGENHPQWKRIKRICKQCGKEFEIKPSKMTNGGGVFCSHSCHSKWDSENHKGDKNANWRGGISFEPYCPKFNNEFREYIRNKFGRVCFLCSITEEENGKRLSVHHVNYNKNCGCDGDKTCQFVPLCVSCNSKVNSNRKMWEAEIKNKMRNKLNGWII